MQHAVRAGDSGAWVGDWCPQGSGGGGTASDLTESAGVPRGLSEPCGKPGGVVALARAVAGESFRRMRKEARRMRAPPVCRTGFLCRRPVAEAGSGQPVQFQAVRKEAPEVVGTGGREFGPARMAVAAIMVSGVEAGAAFRAGGTCLTVSARVPRSRGCRVCRRRGPGFRARGSPASGTRARAGRHRAACNGGRCIPAARRDRRWWRGAR